MEFLDKALESMAIAFTTAGRACRQRAAVPNRQQAEELQAQEEELRAANEELESQTESLRASEAKLKANQAELEQATPSWRRAAPPCASARWRSTARTAS